MTLVGFLFTYFEYDTSNKHISNKHTSTPFCRNEETETSAVIHLTLGIL